MNTKIFLWLTVFFSAFFASAQDQCQVVGWATQNGGVTGGGNATPTVVSDYNSLKNAVTDDDVKVIHVSGTITFPNNGRISFQDQSGKTIFGLPGSKLVSTDLSPSGSGIFNAKRLDNIILQNLVFEGPGAYDTDGNDNLTLDDSRNVWVDHCEFHDGMDGNFDIKNKSNYVSVTWTTFSYEKPPIAGGSGGSNDHRYSNLIGSSDGATGDDGKLKVTFQYCWWGEGCKERMPRVRYGQVHLVNNYFSSSVANQGTRAGFKADLLVEGNYFISGYSKPVDEFKGDYTAILARNNQGANNINKGSAFSPPYNIDISDASTIVSPITTCAGATLTSPGGCSTCIETTDNPTLVLTSGSSNQTVSSVGSISDIVYTWGGSATDVLVSNLPSGLSVSKNTNNKTITISGSPSTSGTYNLSTSQSTGTSVSISGTITLDVSRDCSGVVDGTATLDQCGVCSGGNTGIESCSGSMEAETFCEADATIDVNNTGFMGAGFVNFTNAQDSDGTWYISSTSAGQTTVGIRYANGGTVDRNMSVIINGSTQTTLSGSPTGNWTTWSTEFITINLIEGANQFVLSSQTGEGGPNIDLITFTSGNQTNGGCTVDCNGIVGGGAYNDECGTCVAGNTELVACTQDCAGDWGGNAYIDDCETCVGGNTQQEACTQDCNFEFGGTATIDACGVCSGGSTGLERNASCIDCNGVLNGSAVIDDCGVCTSGNTGQTACSILVEGETVCDILGIQNESDNLGFTGTGYANTDNELGAIASWIFVSESDQIANFNIRYANGGTAPRNGDLYVSGNYVSPVELSTTNGWDDWQLVSIEVPMKEGTNTISISATSTDGLANIDAFHIYSEGIESSNCVLTAINSWNSNKVTFHPNPATSTILLSETSTWKIIDVLGNIILTGESDTIDLDLVSSGINFIKIDSNVYKFVKK